MATLTTTLVRDAKPKERPYEITCSGLPGFTLRVLPSGKKTFVLRHRVEGRDCRTRIGEVGPELPVEEARRRAVLLLGGETLPRAEEAAHARRGGQDRAPEETRQERPAARSSRDAARAVRLTTRPEAPRARHEARDVASAATPTRARPAAPKARSKLTIRMVAERFLRDYVDVYLKEGSARNYEHHLLTHILPALGDRDITSVTRSDVQALHSSLRDRPSAADYVLCVLGSLYTRLIKDWELVDMRNPVTGARRFGSRLVERFLTPEERMRLHAYLEAGVRIPCGTRGHVERTTAWALKLLSFTGLRRDEALGLKWSMIDWQHAVLNLPDTKTGQRSVPVSSQTMALLREIRETTGISASGFVIESRTGGRLRSLNRTWERLRAEIGLEDVRIHDLRHSFASDALMGGVPLAVVGKILGHRQVRTTQRYAHLADHVVRDALEQTAARISEAIAPVTIASATSAAPRAPFKRMSDTQWAKVAVLLHEGRSARAQANLRAVADGIRWVQHHSAPWQKVPREFGGSTTCWRWHDRWTKDGTWSKVVAALE